MRFYQKIVACTALISLFVTSTTPILAQINSRAKQELPDDYYVLYTMVERIARANGLDDKPWRILLLPIDRVNASASDYNLLTFEEGLLDRFEGNASAIACVVGHEMGHHVRQHLGYGPAQTIEVGAQAEIEAEEAKQRERREAASQTTAGGIVSVIGGIWGGRAGRATQIGGEVLKEGGRQRQRTLSQKEREIDEAKKKKIQERVTAINHKQEFEADESGYIYSVRAGFKADGCRQGMEILGRGHGAHVGSHSHPPTKDRHDRLANLQRSNPPTALKAAGMKRLDASGNYLSYEPASIRLGKELVLPGIKILPRAGSTLDDLENILNN